MTGQEIASMVVGVCAIIGLALMACWLVKSIK